MRILILSQWFDPEPTFKGLLFARELRRRGHEVEVLTGFPNYPGGKLYPGYRMRLRQREIMDGISVTRVPLYPSHDRSPLGRVCNYASFALSASTIGWPLSRSDLIYVYHPPATVGLPALLGQTVRRIPVVYDIEDLWPDTVAASGMLKNKIAVRALAAWCRCIYRHADRLIVISPGFRRALIERGVPAGKIEVIYNWCDEQSLCWDVQSPVQHPTPAEFRVIFAGNMGLAQALDPVLQAARLCRQTAPHARFVFVGSGIDRARLEAKAAEMDLTNVLFEPQQPMQAMGFVLAAADALLVHLKDDPLFRITIPSKTQAYLAAGKPILMGVRGDAADLVRWAGAGLVCEPENPASIAHAVAELSSMSREKLARMGESGRRYYVEHLSLKAGVDQFERVFRGLCCTAAN